MGRKTNKQRRQKVAVGAREKAALARAEQQRADQRRRAITVLSSVVAAAVVIAIIAVIALNSTSKSKNDRVVAGTASLVHSVTSVTPAALQTVGKGTATLLAKPISGEPPLTSNGKPEVLFIGGEFCPICAAERWSMIQALSRFGTFSNLSQIHSAVDDGDLATFTFYKSSYQSKYLSFVSVENEDRAQNPLEKMTAAQAALFRQNGNTFPFIDFGGKYHQGSAGYNPSDLTGLSQQQIAAQLKSPSSKMSQDILGEANNLTATICKITNNKPAPVCTTPTITGLQSQLGA